jgi:hypothetical protein
MTPHSGYGSKLLQAHLASSVHLATLLHHHEQVPQALGGP